MQGQQNNDGREEIEDPLTLEERVETPRRETPRRFRGIGTVHDEISGKYRRFKIKHPRAANFLKNAGIGTAKSVGAIVGAKLVGDYVVGLPASYLPKGEYISAVLSPAATAIIHWSASNYLFDKATLNRGFDFLNKWYAVSYGLSGVVAGTLNIVGGLDELVVGILSPSAIKQYAQSAGNMLYGIAPSGIIAGASAFLGWNIPKGVWNASKKFKNAATQTMKYLLKNKDVAGLGAAVVGDYVAIGYLSQHLGIDKATATTLSGATAAATSYLLANYIQNRRWIRRGIKAVSATYGAILLINTEIPSEISKFISDSINFYVGSAKTMNTVEAATKGTVYGMTYIVPIGILEKISHYARLGVHKEKIITK